MLLLPKKITLGTEIQFLNTKLQPYSQLSWRVQSEFVSRFLAKPSQLCIRKITSSSLLRLLLQPSYSEPDLFTFFPKLYMILTSPCLKGSAWEFPFTGFIAMVSTIVTLIIDAFATSYYQKSVVKRTRTHAGNDEKLGEGSGSSVHARATHSQAHSSISFTAESESELLRQRVISQLDTQVLELGNILHSAIIGILLGASQEVETVRTLLPVLSFQSQRNGTRRLHFSGNPKNHFCLF
ncbi:zinc transporter 5-like [Carica papaya]|uniref:zinc transporter 5-like n=1 Tax=Carica papaya TaxID=3649 RepID=UPI000B8CC4BC|nr:zinc transporter 5-like [Carica papaya]